MRDHRGNPGCYILQPADAFAAYALTGAMAEYDGACYMSCPDEGGSPDDGCEFLGIGSRTYDLPLGGPTCVCSP